MRRTPDVFQRRTHAVLQTCLAFRASPSYTTGFRRFRRCVDTNSRLLPTNRHHRSKQSCELLCGLEVLPTLLFLHELLSNIACGVSPPRLRREVVRLVFAVRAVCEMFTHRGHVFVAEQASPRPPPHAVPICCEDCLSFPPIWLGRLAHIWALIVLQQCDSSHCDSSHCMDLPLQSVLDLATIIKSTIIIYFSKYFWVSR